MKSTVHWCHPSVVPTLILTSILAVVGSLPGCGSVSGPQAPDQNAPNADADPDTLPATVVEGDGYGEYVIVANKTEDAANEFRFSVQGKRGTLDTLTWEWDFGDGFVRRGPDQSYTFTEPGSYLVQVTAFGQQGKVAFVLTLEVNVEDTNQPPVADSGVDQTVDEGELVFLYGGASFDPDDGDLTYQWAQLSGNPVHLLSPEAVTASFVAPRVDADSILEFSLTVSDGELTSQDSVAVYVADFAEIASTGPVADAGPDQEVVEGEVVTLNGSESHGSGKTPVSFSWTQIAGPQVELVGAEQAVATFVAPEVADDPVELGFELLVFESDLSAFDEVAVLVTPAETPDDDDGGGGGGEIPGGGGTGDDNCPSDPDKTEPGTCGCGVPDTDSDGDGTADCVDACPDDGGKVSPGACGCGTSDVDSDGDGSADCLDSCPYDPGKTTPGVCGCGTADTDSDGDGTPDCLDECPSGQDTDSDGDGVLDCHDGCPDDPNKTAPGACGCNVVDSDRDSDGTPDCHDGCPYDPYKTEPDTCGCGTPDDDGDGDGTPDCNDRCPDDAQKTDPGICGCGVADTDADGDGVPNCLDGCPGEPDLDLDWDGVLNCDDGCPYDPEKTEPGVCGCDVADTDIDGDGTADCHDECPNDPYKVSPGLCGCGAAENDTDGDGMPDCVDQCPEDPGKLIPGACGCGVSDEDSDYDSVPDCDDACPNDPNKTEPGICGCRVSDQDSDGDGISDCADQCPGEPDVDTDNDGTLNCEDACPLDPAKVSPGLCGCGVSDVDSDGDGVPDCSGECPAGQDVDSDGDGMLDCHDGCPDDPDKTAPGVCGCGVADRDSDSDGVPDCNDQCQGQPDVDSDGDGVLDCNDGCPHDPDKVTPGMCGCGVADSDGDGDGVADCNDGCPNDEFKTSPGQCGCGVPDDDTDSDGAADCQDQCEYDPQKVDPGICGCGVADTDLDGDGTPDCNDACPNDPAKTQPGVCGCGVSDLDLDGDGVPGCHDRCPGQPDVDSDADGTLDCDDGCPTDPDKVAPGLCGCGVGDEDSDADGTPDCNDGCPGDPGKTAPGACGCDVADHDADGDGTPDCNDGCPYDPGKTAPGTCGCGTADSDSDHDGIYDCNDQCPGEPDVDSDGDGTLNCDDACPNDPEKTGPGICGCGVSDSDSDNDGTPDCIDSCPSDPTKIEPGICGCGLSDADADSDGTPDCQDSCPNDPNKTEPGTCGCGVVDADSDGDGVFDCNDICPGFDDSIDTDGDGTPDGCDTPDGGLFIEDFDGYSVGANPNDWLDTAADNSLTENDALFAVVQVGGNNALATSSTAYNIHSHYIGQERVSGPWFEFTGRMRLTDVTGGLGVTFLSAYPNADAYYRLRRFSGFGGDAFQISPHGTNIIGGTLNSGIEPVANTWYRFRVEVQDTGSRTEILAKVWVDGTDEPASWQIDCYDNSATRLTSGTIGVWSMASGIKYWDGLSVSVLDCDVDSDGDGTADCADRCVNDPGKTEPGECGCGTADTDSDVDGAPDCIDQCPGAPDIDSDGDGTPDCADGCPDDAQKTEPGACGCGVADVDANGNGTPDCLEPPTLCASPSSLSFGSTTAALAFEVWNCGGGSLDYTLEGDAAWLTVSPGEGDSSGEHDTITVSVDRTDLPDDTYQAEITVNPNVGAAITVAVTMTVGASAAPMNTASRTTGMAPLAVFFDAVDTADRAEPSGVVQPSDDDYAVFHYRWGFGDPASGTWPTNGKSKNQTTGYVAAHVFENPGRDPVTYTVTLQVISTISCQPGDECRDANTGTRGRCDAQFNSCIFDYEQEITVDPFSGTTYYVSFSSGSDSNSGLSPSAPFKTFGKAMSMLAPNTRVLFKRGDSWVSDSLVIHTANGPGIIGAYYNADGSDALDQPKPRILFPSGSSGFRIFSSAVDWRIKDLALVGALGPGHGIDAVGDLRRCLLLDLEIEGFLYSIHFIMDRTRHSENFVVGCHMHDPGHRAMFAGSSQFAIMGNVAERTNVSAIRIWYNHKGVISQNIIRDSGSSLVKHHAIYPSQYIVISDNELSGRSSAWPVEVAPQGANFDERIHDVLVERNVFRANADTQVSLVVAARRVTIRNNTFIGTGASGTYHAVNVMRRGIEPPPMENTMFNNTAYRGDVGRPLIFCAVNNAAQETWISNNIAAAPSTASVMMTSGGNPSELTVEHNVITSSPGFTDPERDDFTLLPGSPARNTGVVLPQVREDQRGVWRPRESGQDAGAFEYSGP